MRYFEEQRRCFRAHMYCRMREFNVSFNSIVENCGIERWFEMRKTLITILLTVTALFLLTGCSKREPENPVYGDLNEITIQEYNGDTPVSREITVYDSVSLKEFPETRQWLNTYGIREIKRKKDQPKRTKSYLMRFKKKDGTTSSVFIYGDDEHYYLEQDGNFWQGKDLFWSFENLYADLSYTSAFGSEVEDRSFTLLPEYNGAGKAMWMGLTDIDPTNICDTMYRNHAFEEHYNWCIDPEYVAERAEDVRYIFVCDYNHMTYDGYWYNVETGEKVSDSYDTSYDVTAYDLLTGESEMIARDLFMPQDASDAVHAYMERHSAK